MKNILFKLGTKGVGKAVAAKGVGVLSAKVASAVMVGVMSVPVLLDPVFPSFSDPFGNGFIDIEAEDDGGQVIEDVEIPGLTEDEDGLPVIILPGGDGVLGGDDSEEIILGGDEIEDEVIDRTCLCGCTEDDCGCEYICTNPEHSNYLPPVNPVFTVVANKLNTVVATPTALGLKAACFADVTAHDGYGKDITANIEIIKIDGTELTGDFDWEARAQRFGTMIVELNITNGFDRNDTLTRTITIADIPAISINKDVFATEDGDIMLWAGESFTAANIRAALTVSDRYDTGLGAANAVIDWGTPAFNNTVPGVYTITARVTNAQNFSSQCEFAVKVKAKEYPFTLEIGAATNFVMQKTAGTNIREAIFENVFAHDAVRGDITANIVINSIKVDDSAAVQTLNWNTLNNKVCRIVAVLGINGVPGFTGYTLTREIDVVDTPVISLKEGSLAPELYEGKQVVSLDFGSNFDIKEIINLSYTALDDTLTFDDILVSGTVNTRRAGLYTLTLNVETFYSQTSALVVNVLVGEPEDTEWLVVGGYNFSFLAGEGRGEILKERILAGISLKVGEETIYGVFIDSIKYVYNGETLTVKVDETFDFNYLAAVPNIFDVVLAVENPHWDYEDEDAQFITMQRTVTIGDNPVITFNADLFTWKDGSTIAVNKGESLNLRAALDITDKTPNSTLTRYDIAIKVNGNALTGGIFTPEYGTAYTVVFSAINNAGFASNIITVYVEVVAPAPQINVAGDLNLVIAKTNEAGFKTAAINGLTAVDGEGENITDDITIHEIDGMQPSDEYNWTALAQMLGDHSVTLRVTNSYGKTVYLTRNIRIVDIPVISFNNDLFVIEDGYIRVFTGEAFNYTAALSVTDNSPEATLSSSAIVVSGNVNIWVPGTYTLTFNVANAYGVAAQPVTRTVRVRDKVMTDFSGIEIYNKVQEKMYNSYYVAEGRNGSFNTSWDGSHKYDGMSTRTVNNANTYSYTEAYSGYILTFSVGIYSTFNDYRRAMQINYNKNSGVAEYKRDTETSWYQKGFSTSGNLWGKDGNGLIKASYGYTNSNWDMNNYENWFGRPLMQDSNFYITEDTVIGTPMPTPRGDGTYTIEYNIKHDSSKDAPGVKGRINYLYELHSRPELRGDLGGDRYFGNESNMFAKMTYVINSNFQVVSKRVQEQYNWYAASAWWWFRTDFTENYTYDAVQPTGQATPLSNPFVVGGFAMPSGAVINALNTAVVKTGTETGGHEEGDGIEYCVCGCCDCCIECFPRDEDGNIIGREPTFKPEPIITINDSLAIKKGQTADNFKLYLYTGITADDGFGNECLTSVRIYAIDGKKVSDSDFNWANYVNAVGSHTVTYYLVNDVNKYILVDRDFVVSSVPKIEFVYTDTKVDILPTDIGGTIMNVNHIVVLTGGGFNPLANVRAVDEFDPTLTSSNIRYEGTVNPNVEGIYTLTFWVENNLGATSAKRAMFYNVRQIKPTELTYALEAYNLIGETMKRTAFESFSKGQTVASGAGTMPVYCHVMHNGEDETFFENYSAGGSMLGINIDFARKVYRKGDEYRFSRAEGGSFKYNSGNGVITLGSNGWTTGVSMTKANYYDLFGDDINDIVSYFISSDTVTNSKSGIAKNADGTFTISFNIKIDNGTNSAGIRGYVKQIETMSGTWIDANGSINRSGKTTKSFDYASATITFGQDFRIIETVVNESYTVNTGVFISPTSQTATKLTLNYVYPASVSVPKF